MAFYNRIGSMLGQRILLSSRPSMVNAIRCCSYESSKVFVGGLSFDTDEVTLKEAFTRFGEVEDVKIVTHSMINRSRGFGFIKFTEAEAANNALAMDGQVLEGKKLYVSIANERPQGPARAGPERGYHQPKPVFDLTADEDKSADNEDEDKSTDNKG